ncbi:flagellar hook-associated protein FlgL [Povalibacter sp.]|uniref:flagellar hook-associated protein FlgL n=1 Tax=Povalibacter sp. TaxID=1962978 RepID=UPI002F427154
MRLSTQSYYNRSINAMLEQQSALSRIQNQVASGKKINSPADDPIAAVHIIELERSKQEYEQYDKNSALARGRLTLEEQSLADAGNALQRVRELILQASNTGTLSASDRESIAVELASRLQEIQDIGNRQDSNGEYLFAGFSTRTQPFAGVGSGVTYYGDQGARQLQVGPTQRVADSHSGFDVFMNISEGNGTFVTSAGATNTGSASIDVGSVRNPGTWVRDDYTLTFTSPTTWEITDSATPTANVVATGPYTSGGVIAFRGVQVTISGAVAAGDTFAIEGSGTENVFDTLQGVIDALRVPTGGGTATAQLNVALSGGLQQVDQAIDHFLGVRGEVGARLSALDTADAAREDLSIDRASTLSDLRDLDYAEALARMNQQMVALQAAQLSYSQISQLSLFDYLR